MLNFAICDDNQHAINKLSKMLETIMIQNNLSGQLMFSTTKPDELLDYLKTNNINVVLLDIEFNNNSYGLSLANAIRNFNKAMYIIFITGHLEYGLMAYKYKTFDYIPKPLTLERFSETIIRLFDDITDDNNVRYIRLDNNKTIIPEHTIRFIQKDGMKLLFHTDSRDYETYNSFNKIQTQLPKQFIRCHKSYIVNMDKVSNVNLSNNTISFENNELCYIGPKYKNNFKEVFTYGNISNNLDGAYNAQ